MDFFPKKSVRHLLTVNDDRGVENFILDASAYSIGRDPSNGIVVHSDSVSRQHAILFRMPNGDKTYCYAIQDGNVEGKLSANGIIVNGIPTKKHVLSDGDEIALGGKVTLIYRTLLLSKQELEEKVHHLQYRKLKGNVLTAPETVQAPLENVPTKLDKLSATKLDKVSVPEEIKKEINSFRQCYEFVTQELKDLDFSKSDRVTIAVGIYHKL